ncbi:MAG: glycoside hydrolase family 97 protein [Alphaproteobacteria bacterium]|nr:glycoside hydrolase family 97 protein [Alphaproteobacteria bacterium]
MHKVTGIALAAGVAFFSNAVFAEPVSVSSPDGSLKATLDSGADGLVYRVEKNGVPVIENSELGFVFRKAAPFGKGLKIAQTETTSFDDTWEQPWGERQFVRNHYNELKAVVKENGADGRAVTIVFRVYDDGLGFRYVGGDDAFGEAEIMDELTEFTFAEPATAWWIPSREHNRYEYIYQETPLADVTIAHTPITMRTKSGLYVSLHEAALLDYSGMSLLKKEGRTFEADLSPWADGAKVKLAGAFKTPWRTLQISDEATGLLDSSLILNLNEPNRLGDVSWVEPGKYVGIWWGMHLALNTWGSGPKHGATTEETKKYLDFASKYGFKGVLVEGWNEGWDGDWFNNWNLMNFTTPYPDFNFPELAEYARERGVRIIGHHETSGGVTNYENQLEDAFDLYEKMGVRQVKTGYVADAGEIAREEDGKVFQEWHDGQYMSRHHEKVLIEAAKRKISINSHEPIKDTGLRRTYPNWISREGARGMEYNAWGSPPNPPSHTAIIPFTRMLSGPMDFTPGIFDLLYEKEQPDNRVQTTLTKQLALYVVLYSPIQMAADLPHNYEARMDAFQFIRDVPTDWSESHALTGDIGKHATFARKERGGNDWYLGSVTNEEARTLTVSLDFLDEGKRYEAQIYRDGDDADWDTNPYSMVIEKKLVSASDTMKLKMAAGGGIAIRFKALAD